MMSRNVLALIAFLVVLMAAEQPLEAYWQPNGTAVSQGSSDQLHPVAVSDGAGGAIITWTDYRSARWDIYAQRINAGGKALWSTDGISISTQANDQINQQIISDGAGGAIITWQDGRTGNYDIYAQRVDANGNPQWTANGVPLCSAAGDQYLPVITSDGAGGAIVAWMDQRTNYDIYAQRINAYGTVLWAANGVAICNDPATQAYPQIVPSGAGGAIIVWQDERPGAAIPDIYAQRINSSGAAIWTANGVVVCNAAQNQIYPRLIADGADGAIIVWSDYRSGNTNIYAQRLNALGTALWTSNGVVVCNAPNNKYNVQIVSVGPAGGAIVAWEDIRTGTSVGIYAQRLNVLGAAQWTANGVAVCASGTEIYYMYPQMSPDGSGGAIFAWDDSRTGGSYHDIYAQYVNGAGAAQWAANGVAVCTAAITQDYPQLVSDSAGGAIITWEDDRSGITSWDINAHQIDSSGRLGYLAPVIHSIRDVRADQGGKVNLAWDASKYDNYASEITRYTLWRALKTPSALAILNDGALLLDGPEQVGPATGTGAIRIERAAGRRFYWELIDSQDAYYLDNYGKVVATAADSVAGTFEYEYFQVIAHTSDASRFYVSAPDSGYSVDNLSPSTPKSLAGRQEYAPAGLSLTWSPNTEPDLGHYAVYRGTSASFVPGPSNLIASPADTSTFDGGWRWNSGYYYKVSAIDIHGNESLWVVLSPDAVTGADTPKAPEATYLSQNFPNPFNPTTRIAFGLSAPAQVSLRIYDAAGRLVRVLVEGTRAAGTYAEMWNGKDDGGRAVSSGIYFYRLDAGSYSQTRKMVLLR